MSAAGDYRPLEDLAGRLGYRFQDLGLLRRALTHRSFVPGEEVANESYQRLEFLGDRVLALVVAEMLYTSFPALDEGGLARRLNQLVRKETCAEVAVSFDVGDAIRLGTGERKSGGRRNEAILGDVMEALIAAIHLDGGFAAAEDFVQRAWRPRMEGLSGPLRDAKTTLQEWAQGRGLPTPGYRLVDRSGPDHAPSFTVEALIGDTAAGRGIGRSKRDAEQAAATDILVREGLWSAE